MIFYPFRWLHAECDGLNSEQDAEDACSLTYHCSQCRPLTQHLGIYSSFESSIISKAQIRKINVQRAMPPKLPPVSDNSGRKTKTLHNLKAKRLTKAALKEEQKKQRERQPLYPVQNIITNEFGTFDVDLHVLKSRLKREDIIKANYHLTDTGLKEIKSRVIRAPIRKPDQKTRKKESFGVKSVAEVKSAGQVSDDTPFTNLNQEDSQSVCQGQADSTMADSNLSESVVTDLITENSNLDDVRDQNSNSDQIPAVQDKAESRLEIQSADIESNFLSPDLNQPTEVKKEEVLEDVEISELMDTPDLAAQMEDTQEEHEPGPEPEDTTDPVSYF